MSLEALRLQLDGAALAANWRWMRDRAGVACAAAVKANGYGLGARDVVARLADAGCRTFLVSSWDEARALGAPPAGEVLVLHGFVASEGEAAAAMPWARPVLNSAGQAAAWRASGIARLADLMVDTGMNRLGIAEHELADVLGPDIGTVHGHLACADEPGHPLTAEQLGRFRAVAAASPNHAHAFANSAGVCIGREFAFDMVRPGLGLYGASPYPGIAMRPVASVEARIVQVRTVRRGETVGYGATWRAARDSRVATLNIGYADGFPRASAPAQAWDAAGVPCLAIGRVSMDLTAVDVTDVDVRDGDWLTQTLDLPALADASGRSQYELLVSLGRRYERRWT